MFKKALIPLLLVFALILTGCSLINKGIAISDAKIATGVDENLMPVRVTNIFPKGTSKVSCWFQWRNAKINTQLLAKWHYVTDDVHILNYDFNIPKKDGNGSVIISMPEEKTLPSGSYKVELYLQKKLLRSLDFKVE